ncbi:DUF3800 domain-containing protein [Curtobacterium flaccumfaciens pv. flaccumfaciens]|uniref:DUF3800 domain-containing protein n=1 Tax=Curtobacterium flaccumfaciens TaxID=2035 RepID=UPI001AD9FC24|nr:DUF3800 domain-containing protein [Curtobacterium flaccumfaciens]MBO9058843.1 DUF3800 domain-containing protein [Curtobacterium flaccumfaciens pv. flaccumfaciens]
MHFAFVDDSKQKGLRSGMGDLLSLGAVIFAEDQLRPFSESMHAMRDEFGIPRDVELKWAMPHGKDNNYFRKRGETGLQDKVRSRMLELAAKHEARAVVVVLDLGRMFVNEDKAKEMVLKYLYERIIQALNRKNLGVVVFDKPGGDHQDEDAWIGATLELSSYGTEFIKPDEIVLPILTAPSHHHEHLQLADLVTGSVTAAVAGNKFGMALAPELKKIMHTNAYGYIGGAGLKLFPDDLVNLHFHVFGEDTFAKVAKNSGWGLPWKDRDYFEDDGLTA